MGLFVHDACGHWRPLSVLFTITFFGLELEFKLLLGSELHDNNWILWLSCFAIDKLDWLNRNIFVACVYVGRFHFIDIWSWPFEVNLKIKIDRALITISLAVTLIEQFVLVNICADKRYEATPMRQEFVVES